MRKKRLAVARLWFEGNAFCPIPADAAAFEAYEWQRGVAGLERMRGTATELGAVARFAEENPDWEVVVLRCAAALPAGPIEDAVFDRLRAEILEDLQADSRPWDAVYLSLHGAAITATRETPELDLARSIAELLPEVPLGASFDLHGNLPPEWANVLDYASAYRTHPHIDMDQTAERVLTGLRRCVEDGLQTRCTLINEPVILPSINMRTTGGPMAELEALAREATRGAILDISVFGGFPYSDTRYTGASVLVVSDATQDPQDEEAQNAARMVMERVRELAPQFRITLPSPEEALQQAIAITEPGLIAITDSGDNPLSGGCGDTPELFRALLSAHPSVETVFASFTAPEVVLKAQQAGTGGRIEVTLGGRYGKHFGEAVRVVGTVDLLTDGRFVNSGPMQSGVERLCGNTAVLRVEGLPDTRVIVTERVVAADDPAFYALHGVDLNSLRLLCVKAKNHFRAAFAERCVRIIDCDAPGPACQDLSQLPFRNKHVSAGY